MSRDPTGSRNTAAPAALGRLRPGNARLSADGPGRSGSGNHAVADLAVRWSGGRGALPAGQAAVPAVIILTAAPTTCKHRLAEVSGR
ncbi:hypothetical protein GCM10010466_13200 [Planomonospora alba]|uniref:Uncharacterized protein n=1 Tax=Planomonospora alba TaxID=161354 RepID=A0ABP6MSQ9_9ACTN